MRSPAWAPRVVELAEPWCALCGERISHPSHAGHHWFLRGAEGPSDGRAPMRGAMRLPGWEPLDELCGARLFEAYRRPGGRLVPGALAFVLREPRSLRWRWGVVDGPAAFASPHSEQWLHEALWRAIESYPEVFAC